MAGVIYPIVLCVCVCFFNYLFCSACILQMRNKPNEFLIQIKVYFFIIIYTFIFYFFFFRLSNFSHMKRLRLVDYFVCLFCFLRWNCRVIIHNFIIFLPFPKRCTMFYIFLHFNVILYFILKFALFFTTSFIMDLF